MYNTVSLQTLHTTGSCRIEKSQLQFVAQNQDYELTKESEFSVHWLQFIEEIGVGHVDLHYESHYLSITTVHGLWLSRGVETSGDVSPICKIVHQVTQLVG